MVFASGATMQGAAAALCGGFASFSLGLVGGGGSILAVPLILYVVGLQNAHVAIGTAALAVAASAYINMIPHARAGHVRWGPAFAFAASGVLGAALGSTIGKLVDGQKLIMYFAFLMCFVAFLMLRPTQRSLFSVTATSPSTPYRRLCGTGLGAGSLSGFFGIGGGFLVVPGLMFAGRLPIVDAIGTSLFAVGSFGLTTAVNYSIAGQVDWAHRHGIRWRWCRRRLARHPRSKPSCQEARGAQSGIFGDDPFRGDLYALSLLARPITSLHET